MQEEPIPATSTARRALERAAPLLNRRPVLIVSDYDGTLAEIRLDPWAASIEPGARRALRRLASADGVTVVLLSGRTAVDLAERTRVGAAVYLGNHGLERGLLPRGGRADHLRVETADGHESFGPMALHLADAVPRIVPEPWLIVERKPPAVAFHYRSAPDIAAAAVRVREAVDRLDSEGAFVRHGGRRVLELRPPGATAKRDALLDLLAEIRPAACFLFGDDRGDAEAFKVLVEARSAGTTDGLAIAVRSQADPTGDGARAADIVLPSPADAARLLSGMARRLGYPRRGL
jgi:trehalose 6-phosphate phosphatase